MGLQDTINGAVSKLAGTASRHRDRIDQGIDKATSFASQRTGGKYDDKIAQGSERLRSGIDRLTASQDAREPDESGQPGQTGERDNTDSRPKPETDHGTTIVRPPDAADGWGAAPQQEGGFASPGGPTADKEPPRPL